MLRPPFSTLRVGRTVVGSNRRMPRQRNNARPAVAIAPWDFSSRPFYPIASSVGQRQRYNKQPNRFFYSQNKGRDRGSLDALQSATPQASSRRRRRRE